MIIEKIILGIGIVLLIISILKLNFNNISWKENKIWYLNILTAVCIILSMIFTMYDI